MGVQTISALRRIQALFIRSGLAEEAGNVQAAESGGMAYFEELYERYATDVLRVCYFYLGDRQKAEDVCQDVFVRLITTSPQLQEGREKAWLLKVALNRCRDLWRGAWLKRVVLGAPPSRRRTSAPAPRSTPPEPGVSAACAPGLHSPRQRAGWPGACARPRAARPAFHWQWGPVDRAISNHSPCSSSFSRTLSFFLALERRLEIVPSGRLSICAISEIPNP